MAGKRYQEMTNEELTDKACQIAYARKRSGEQHANLIYALAFRIREIEGQAPSPTEAPPQGRPRTVEELAARRGLSREALEYLGVLPDRMAALRSGARYLTRVFA